MEGRCAGAVSLNILAPGCCWGAVLRRCEELAGGGSGDSTAFGALAGSASTNEGDSVEDFSEVGCEVSGEWHISAGMLDGCLRG